MKRIHRISVGGLAVTMLAWGWLGCRGCGRVQPQSALYLVPADAQAAVWVPDLEAFARGAESFVAGATRTSGAGFVARLRTEFARRYGLDPLDAKSYSALGLAPSRGAVVFTPASGAASVPAPALAVAVDNKRKLLATLKERLQGPDEQAGQFILSQHEVHGRTVHTVSQPFGSETVPVWHFAFVGEYAVLVDGAGEATLRGVLERATTSDRNAPSRSALATDATYQALVNKVEGGQLYVFSRAPEMHARTGEPTPTPPAATATAALTSVAMRSTGLEIDGFTLAPVDTLHTALTGASPIPLATDLGSDAAAVFLTRVLRPEVFDALQALPGVAPHLQRLQGSLQATLGDAGDLRQTLLPLLAGPVAIGIYTHPLAGLAALSTAPKQGQRRWGALLDVVQVALVAEVTQPENMAAFLDKVHTALAARGQPMRQRQIAVGDTSVTVYEPAKPGEPRLGWALYQDRYVYGAGSGRLQATLQQVQRRDSALVEQLRAGVAEQLVDKPGVSLFVLRGGVLADALSSLIADNKAALAGFGALLTSAADLLRTIGDVAVAINVEKDGVRLRLRERLQ